MFEDLVSCGTLDLSNEGHVKCVRYCFMKLIEKELSDFVNFWNCHHIRQSSGAVRVGCQSNCTFYLITQLSTVAFLLTWQGLKRFMCTQDGQKFVQVTLTKTILITL